MILAALIRYLGSGTQTGEIDFRREHEVVRSTPRILGRFGKQTAPREYLTPAEVEMLCKAARERGRYGHRDATMILIAYRHGLRVSELVALRWDQVDFAHVPEYRPNTRPVVDAGDAGVFHMGKLREHGGCT